MDSCHPNAAGTVASVTTICTLFHTAGNARKEESKLSPRGTEEFLGCWLLSDSGRVFDRGVFAEPVAPNMDIFG